MKTSLAFWLKIVVLEKCEPCCVYVCLCVCVCVCVCDNDQRDGHLKSEDFFYAEKYPKMTFKSTSFKKKSGNKYVLKGNLTMRGVTKSVTLNVKHGGTIANDGYGNTKSGFIISGEINRIDYGVAWNAKTEHGGWTVGEEVALTIKLELVKQK